MQRDIYSKLVAEARQTLTFRILRSVVLAILGLLVISAQVALPLGSFLSAEEVDFWGTDDEWKTDDWRAFWNARLQFLSIREPWNLPFPWRGPTHVRSLAVCKDELIVLYTTGKNDRHPKAITRCMVRFNLRTGRATTSQPPAGVEHVVSDGKELWWLPGDTLVTNPFLWDGRPRDLIRTNEGLTQVVEFIDEKWQKTELFVLLPRSWPSSHEDRRPSRCATTTESFEFVSDDGEYYKIGVELGTKAQAEAYANRFDGEEEELPLQQMGFHSISNLKDDPDYLDEPICRWFERGAPCAIDISRDEHETVGFQWQRYEAGKPIESKFVATRVRWLFEPGGILPGATFSAVAAPDGKVYIVAQGDDDLRIHILLWENGALRLVAQRADPMIWRVCVDVGLFLGLACVVPGMLLAVLSAIVQHWVPLSVDPDLAPFAAVVRRGQARMVDLVLVLLPLALSVVLHPDVMGWWHHVADALERVLDNIDDFRSDMTSLAFQSIHESFLEYLGALCEAPFVWPWAVVSVIIGVGQIVWQGRAGRTVGKWLLRIKVVRTTLRPCGLARSLLRELLLFIDSTLLLSWVPGVIAMLSNTKSQRIGDWMADTIVIRD